MTVLKGRAAPRVVWNAAFYWRGAVSRIDRVLSYLWSWMCLCGFTYRVPRITIGSSLGVRATLAMSFNHNMILFMVIPWLVDIVLMGVHHRASVDGWVLVELYHPDLGSENK